MTSYLFNSLIFFRKCFSRTIPWILFCMVVLGFIGSGEMVGVTSFCRFWGVGEYMYHRFRHFFRYSAWSLSTLVSQWAVFVLKQHETVFVQDRAVLLGDHTHAPKDGRQMPGVVSLHQESETQSKPSYFRAHCWGALGLVIGSMSLPFCLPLRLAIHLGFIHLGQNNRAERDPKTMGTRVVQMAIDFVQKNNLPSVLVLDAFFPSKAIFNLAASLWSIALKQPLLTVIVRAKKNCVAYFQPEERINPGAGRPPKYGEKIKLMELFDHAHGFTEVTCNIYGKTETILLSCLDLLWKPTGGLIRFVLARTSRGPIVLMCSNLAQDPVAALELYCLRSRIEVMFDMLKNLLGVFRYRFWSKKMPRHSRKPQKNKELKSVPSCNIKPVQSCWEAYERFVMLGAIALGLLQLLAIKFAPSIWEQFDAYLRTRSREIPSERTVKYVMASILVRNIFISAPQGIIRIIREQYLDKIFSSKNPSSPP